MEFSEKLLELAAEAEEKLEPIFKKIDEVAFKNTVKVMDAFREHHVSDAMFGSSSGYGYDDKGRDTLDLIWNKIEGEIRIRFQSYETVY